MKKLFVVGISLIGISTFTFIWYYKKITLKSKCSKAIIKIHNTKVAYVIGRYGETLKDIHSKCLVKIKFITLDKSSEYTQCLIKGNKEDVNFAVGIINHIKSYDDNSIKDIILFDDRNKFEVCKSDLFSNEPSYNIQEISNEINGLTQNNYEQPFNQKENKNFFVWQHVQKLYSINGDELIPVYISAIASPELFWIQAIKTKEYVELHQLTIELAEFYESNPEFNVPLDISDIKPGFICALFFDEDNRWYRVEVNEVIENDDTTLIDLYFLDYGESFYKTINYLRRIPSKFLNLNFQAIQCGLANIKPLNNTWSEEAIILFETLTHVAQCYTLLARAESSTIANFPLLTLIDTNSQLNINIGEELVKNGYAQYYT